jgi:hypothetical protein
LRWRPIVRSLDGRRRRQAGMVASRCSAGGCTPILARIGPATAIVFLSFILVMAGLFWWGARRKSRRTRSAYEFDKFGRAYRVPDDKDFDA